MRSSCREVVGNGGFGAGPCAVIGKAVAVLTDDAWRQRKDDVRGMKVHGRLEYVTCLDAVAMICWLNVHRCYPFELNEIARVQVQRGTKNVTLI